jgi:hypothetical protein
MDDADCLILEICTIFIFNWWRLQQPPFNLFDKPFFFSFLFSPLDLRKPTNRQPGSTCKLNRRQQQQQEVGRFNKLFFFFFW